MSETVNDPSQPAEQTGEFIRRALKAAGIDPDDLIESEPDPDDDNTEMPSPKDNV